MYFILSYRRLYVIHNFFILPFQTQWQDTPTMCTTWTNWLYMWHPSQLRTMKVYRYMINKKLLNMHGVDECTIHLISFTSILKYLCSSVIRLSKNFGNSEADHQIALENYAVFMFSLSQKLHIYQIFKFFT